MEKYLDSECLTFNNLQEATTVADILMKNGYAVLLTREEYLYVINWVWCESGTANRNDVVFRNRGAIDDELFDKANDNDNEEEDISEFYARMSGDKQ